MKERLYIMSDTILKRKQNTLFLEKILIKGEEESDNSRCEFFLDSQLDLPTGDKKYIPIENVEAIFTFGHSNFNSRFLYFLSHNHIPLHVFNVRGNYCGSFLPGNRAISGSILLNQAKCFSNIDERIEIAKQIISASVSNELANVKYYANRQRNLTDYVCEIEELMHELNYCNTVNELMGIEGIIKKIYYDSWRKIFNYPLHFNKRIKNPPPDIINSLISYGNMIVYSICLNEIYITRLYPEIGYVHSPGDAKLSLSYDLADIFKPIITDRSIFKVINRNIITEKDYFVKNGFCRIKKEAKQKFVAEIESRLITKIKIPNKTKRISYRRIIREECYKLIKHFNGDEKYEAFVTKW